MATRKLSTIELTVLGIAWLRGPCTTYVIMRELGTSESTYHKSRAGTAYSVTKRLLEFGLLINPENEERDENRVQISESGIEALQQWMTPPIPLEDVAHSVDLLRTRFFFLGALTPETRIQFIDNALASLRIFAAKCEELLKANEDLGEYFGVLATLGVVMETRARIEWLTIVRKFVAQPMPQGSDWAKTMIQQLK
jgi:DNA-binding PadR family transcriptional regulator